MAIATDAIRDEIQRIPWPSGEVAGPICKKRVEGDGSQREMQEEEAGEQRGRRRSI